MLSEAKNEYSSRLVNILTPLVLEGLRSIFQEAIELCEKNDEEEKYLMTFQNFLSRVPKWNATIIEEETKRIIDKSGCEYLEDLLTCVHITQLKVLTSIRVCQKQKKVEIDIPKLSDFIHKVYISFARKIYSNVFLFETGIPPLTYQKNMRECELICKVCILDVIRDNIPVEQILRAYIDDTVEEEVIEEMAKLDASKNEVAKDEKIEEKANNTKMEIVKTGVEAKKSEEAKNSEEAKKTEEPKKEIVVETPTSLSFNDKDLAVDIHGKKEEVVAPKDLATLEQISKIRNEQRKLEEAEYDDDEKIKIHGGEDIKLDILDVQDIDKAAPKLKAPVLDIEVLQ